MKYLDRKLFWKMHGTSWKRCGTIEIIKNIFDNESFTKLETVLIGCGVNDIDFKPGYQVADELLALCNHIRISNPTVKIIISEVTPRNDALDTEVIKCNQRLTTEVKHLTDVHLVVQSNLRENNWNLYHDVKHIKKNSIAKYAGNLKSGIRKVMNTIKMSRNSDNASVTRDNSIRMNVPLRNRLSNLAGYTDNDVKGRLIDTIVNAIKGLSDIA